jgi:hypothetical protein
MLSSSLVHGLITTTSLLGNRFKVGVITLVNGSAQVVCAVFLGHRFGLVGVAAAMVLTDVATAMPSALVLLRQSTDLTIARFGGEVFGPWAARFTLPAAFAAATGLFYLRLGFVPAAVLTAVAVGACLWTMRELYAKLPLGERFSRWLVALRLMPAVAPAIAEQP